MPSSKLVQPQVKSGNSAASASASGANAPSSAGGQKKPLKLGMGRVVEEKPPSLDDLDISAIEHPPEHEMSPFGIFLFVVVF